MSSTSAKRFFCFTQDKVEGPFELVELAGLLRAKQIESETPVCMEGTEEWIVFRDRPEYTIAREIPAQVVEERIREQKAAAESHWSLRRTLNLLWFMAPALLFLGYRVVRMYFELSINKK